MAKKKHDVMAKEKEFFIRGKLNDDGTIDVPGAVRMGVSEQAAEAIFDEMTAFASYAFNKSHAAAYGFTTVRTAWLKCHYPVEFMASLLNSIAGNTAKVTYYIEFCRRKGIRIMPPDVNRSLEQFSVEVEGGEKRIRFGLNAIKNLGHNAIRTIIDERRDAPYTGIYDFIDRVTGDSANKKSVESLIKSGALDTLPGNRAQKLCVYESAMDAVSKRNSNVVSGQLSLFDDAGAEEPEEKLPLMPDFPKREILNMEKEFTGIYLSGHPLEEYQEQLSAFSMTSAVLGELADEKQQPSYDGKRVEMGGIIAEKKTKATKNGSMMCIVSLEDMYGSTEVLVFPKVYEQIGATIMQGQIAVLSGRLSCREDETPKLVLDSLRPIVPDAEAAKLRQQPAPAAKPAAAPGKLFLRLSREQIGAVQFILETTPGNIKVYFYIAEEKKNYLAPSGCWVNSRFDRQSLVNLLGEDSVVLK